jgi:hypothetical protein
VLAGERSATTSAGGALIGTALTCLFARVATEVTLAGDGITHDFLCVVLGERKGVVVAVERWDDLEDADDEGLNSA